MKEDFEKRVLGIKWSSYPHPCMQDQALIPGLLLRMACGSDGSKREAAIGLWDIAAHQGNVGPSSVPVTGFLVELLEEMPAAVRIETLDTLYQFSNYFAGEQWSSSLRGVFLEAVPLFKRLCASDDDEVASLANMIIENIESNEP